MDLQHVFIFFPRNIKDCVCVCVEGWGVGGGGGDLLLPYQGDPIPYWIRPHYDPSPPRSAPKTTPPLLDPPLRRPRPLLDPPFYSLLLPSTRASTPPTKKGKMFPGKMFNPSKFLHPPWSESRLHAHTNQLLHGGSCRVVNHVTPLHVMRPWRGCHNPSSHPDPPHNE